MPQKAMGKPRAAESPPQDAGAAPVLTHRPGWITFPLLVFVVGLALRVLPILLAPQLPIGLDDMFQYDMLARSIVAGDGYRWYGEDDLELIETYVDVVPPADYDPRGVLTSFRAPGYPAFLALVYAGFGAGPARFRSARLAQAALGAALGPLTWALGRQIGYRERTARWAGLITMSYPLLVVYPLALISETLFLPLLTAALLLTLRAATQTKALPYAIAGGALGLAALTRSTVAGFVLLIALWCWLTATDRRAGIRHSALLLLVFLAVTLPWAVRNSLLHHQLSWIENSLAYNLYIGYHPQSTGTFQYGISLDLLPIIDDAERNAQGMRAFWGFLRAAPERVPLLALKKIGYFWRLEDRPLIYFYGNGLLGRWPTWLLATVFALIWGPFAALAITAGVGAVCGRLDRQKALVIALIVYFTLVHALIMAEARFHAPLLPVLAVLSGIAISERPWRQASARRRTLALGLVVALCGNWAWAVGRNWQTYVGLFGPNGHSLHLPY